MSSSTDVAAGSGVAPFRTRDLRVGTWTRLAPDSALGDPVSERTLTEVAEQARAAAQAQGYSVGWAQGRREAAAEARVRATAEAERLALAEEQRAAEHRDAVQALLAAAAQLRAVLDGAGARVEAQGTELAWALTEQLVGHEVRGATAADVVRRVLALAPTGEVACVRLHPDHLESPELKLLADGTRCVADPTLGRLDAVVEVADHAFDLRIDAAMTRVREVLA
ncbi:hypothetical protein [Nocardioides jishulii]|uniref:Flagellar assembly protein FliH/Type III secretion system HrpE domain-containing protein n=1 Tax=Nocardioides jishulii TaxID=2575440 RepID=A0A4U2YTJ8_9ACTN|nr:hypothetical protein [Nocardioides jishulii]QCX28587.1 hypothetical protein FCL41_14380 [Nocardioides jishulii]TKI64520.1 hypothetical protein FC770_05195 [Nocardioides jishulii]